MLLPAVVSALLLAATAGIAASPASADGTAAPLVTTNGVAIRVDENAINGPALNEIQTSLQPFVDQMIYNGAQHNRPVDNYESLNVSSDLALSFAFEPPSAAQPDGGVKLHATISNIDIHFKVNPPWPFSDCSIWVKPSTATVDASANVDRSRLPDTPLTLNPVQATWDDNPDVSTSGVCWAYLIDDAISGWWDDIVGNSPTSTATLIENQLNSEAQGLLDNLWQQHVEPVLNSLNSFGITVDQLRTDAHGLIVTGDVDASNLTIPGLGGPYDVSDAPDAGVTSDVNDLLSQRSPGVIVSVAPNVANQFMDALYQALSGNLGTTAVPASIEDVLLPPAVRDNYADDGWTVRFGLQSVPFTEPTGAGGAPQLQLPELTMQFYNPSYNLFLPVATFTGSMQGIDLVAENRPNATTWGPGFSTANASLSVTRTQANSDAAQWAQTSQDLLPFAQSAFDQFNSDIFVQYFSFAPIAIGDLSVNLCTSCGRYPGDQRYTETFTVS